MIEIHRYVIHELEKKAKTVITKLKLSESLAEIDEFSELLLLKIHESFKEDSSTKHSKFKENESTVFSNTVINYINNEYKEELFLKFASDSLIDLESDLKKENFSAGGFFVYADYTIQSKRYIVVTLIRKTDGFDTEIINNVIRIKSVKNLNINKLAMGFRLNLDIFLNQVNDERHYLAIISNSKDVSEYFKGWVAASGVINSDSNTNSFIKIIKGIEIPNKYSSKQDFWAAIHEFVTIGKEKIIKLKVIGAHFFADDYTLIAYADQEKISIDSEFTYNENKLKELIQIKVNADGINLTIRMNRIESSDIDKERGIVIIQSIEFAEKLLEQLELK